MKCNYLTASLMIVAVAAGNSSNLKAEHVRSVLPDAVVDLRTSTGTAGVAAQWRYSDTSIQEISHRDVGSDLKATGKPNRTFDFTPDARATDFDDSKWEVIKPESLEDRRGHGRLSFNWYRLNVIVPDKVAAFNTAGST